MLHQSRSKDRVHATPGPSFMTSRQKGQTSFVDAPPSSKEDAALASASASSAAFVRKPNLTQDRFTAQYLKDLRSNPVQRPTGARPPPSHFGSVRGRNIFTKPIVVVADSSSESSPTKSPTESSSRSSDELQKPFEAENVPIRSSSALSMRGRPVAQPPRDTMRKTSGSTIDSTRSSSVGYAESGRRTIEREEAQKLRKAMEDLDMDKEHKIFADAQDEAAELVWKHQNPAVPFKNPDAPYSYPTRKERGSHSRSHSVGESQEPQQRSISRTRHRYSYAEGAAANVISESIPSSRKSSGSSQKSSKATKSGDVVPMPQENNKPIMEPVKATKVYPADEVVNSMKSRRTPSGSKRTPSGSLFRNPDDKIYEEPEEVTTPEKYAPSKVQAPASIPLSVRRNPFARVKFAVENIQRSNTDPVVSLTKFDKYEVHKNPPTQSRNGAYTANAGASTPPKSADGQGEEIKMKDGKEVRSDDIVAATSLRLKDRSPRLPTPSMVSDSPGRPIVSFQKDYKPREVELKEVRSGSKDGASTTHPRPYPSTKAASAPILELATKSQPEATSANDSSWLPPIRTYERYDHTKDHRKPIIPAAGSSRPPIPTICVPDGPEVPTVIIPNEAKPPAQSSRAQPPPTSINGGSVISADAPPLLSMNSAPVIPRDTPSSSPLPSPPRPAPVPRHNSFAPARSTRPLPPSSTRPLPTPTPRTTASTRNFPHSQPSPNSRPHWTPTAPSPGRSSTLCSGCALPISGRIVSAAGERFHPDCFACHHCTERLECVAFYPEPSSSRTDRLSAGDPDHSLRFYCHLDYHEFFSPRCKSCKTPIEGEVVVACGAEWHVGHFFCAQCGDPFDEKTPFVERDGYAWCVVCCANRFSAKCRGCRKPVVDMVVRALGSEWHGECFVCVECNGPFEDGRYFLRGDSQDPVCVRCEERRLKA